MLEALGDDPKSETFIIPSWKIIKYDLVLSLGVVNVGCRLTADCVVQMRRPQSGASRHATNTVRHSAPNVLHPSGTAVY